MLNRDHIANKAKLAAIARPLNVSVLGRMTAVADAEYLKLKILSGASLDKEFARSMAKDHQDDIDAYRKKNARNHTATAKLAKATLPTLQKHLAKAQRLSS